jgi:2-polyprenyl-3-methyl-5-hydroxy-6-metoxy-1,4-benzoquinol methylase
MEAYRQRIGCLLCKHNGTLIVDTLSVSLLRKVYKKTLQTDIGDNKAYCINLHVCQKCGLKFFHPTWTGDESLYESLQRFPWYYQEEKQEYSIASQYILPTDKVLEIGAGKGVFSSKIRCHSYVGLEFSQLSVQMGTGKGVNLYKQSIEDHSIQHKEHYDAVCSFQVLEHVINVYEFIHASIRSLKSGGKLILSVPNDNAYIGSHGLINHVLNMPPHHVSRWTDDCLRYIAHLFDLRVINIHYEDMAEIDVIPYARCLIENGIREIICRKYRALDPLFQNFFMRVPIKVLSHFLKLSLRNPKFRPIGHSLTIVYQKS